MEKNKEYSIWIIPPNDVYHMLSNLIIRLAKQYSTPVFDPHITLLGDIALPEDFVVSRTNELARKIRPFNVTLTTIGYLDDFFRSLFIEVAQTKELMEANWQARKLFKRGYDPEYFPHLSLMYGDIEPQVKERIIAEIGRYFNIKFSVASIHIALASSKIDPKEWRILTEFVLKTTQGEKR